MAFTLTSSAFDEGGQIPVDNTAMAPISPSRSRGAACRTARPSWRSVMDDPTARGFVHWVVVGIPADATGIPG